MNFIQAKGKVQRILTEYQAFKDLETILQVAAEAEAVVTELGRQKGELLESIADLEKQEDGVISLIVSRAEVKAAALEKAIAGLNAGRDALEAECGMVDSFLRELQAKKGAEIAAYDEEKAAAREDLLTIRIAVEEEGRKLQELKNAIALLKAAL